MLNNKKIDSPFVILISTFSLFIPPISTRAERDGQKGHLERHLSIHHGPVPLLPRKQARMAKFHSAQLEPQRLFHQNRARRQETGQGQLLDVGPGIVQYVR